MIIFQDTPGLDSYEVLQLAQVGEEGIDFQPELNQFLLCKSCEIILNDFFT